MSLMILVLLGVGVLADAQEKKPTKLEDSPVVAATRKKLETTIPSVDFKDQKLEECLKEIEDQAELKFHYTEGVSRNQSVTFAAKDKTVKEILSGMFKGRGLGFLVHRKQNANDRYEGYVDIVQGDQRGDETAPKKEAKADSKPKPEKTPKADSPPGDASEAQEKAAASKLKSAKVFIEEGQPNDAREYLEDLLKKYPKSKVAPEAKQLLEKLKK